MPTETLEREKIHEARLVRTASRHKGAWMENIQANKPRIIRDLSELWLDSDGGEIISVAAGPSLAFDLHRIRTMAPGRQIVCVDMALKFLVNNGIFPDYVISTDASARVKDFLETGEISAKLILNVIAHPQVAKSWRGNAGIYWFVMANQFYDLDHKDFVENIHTKLSGVGTKLVPGGNVSSVALGFALSARNASKVYLFGHDFCWKEEMYCGGINKDLADERIRLESDAGTLLDSINTSGEKVKTNLSLMEFSKWHKDAVKNFGNHVVNCSSSTILKT